MELNQIISKNLTELRKKNKLTQMELAEKLDFSNKSISKWESGEAVPSIEVLLKLAKLYNVGLDYFVSEVHENETIKKEEEKPTKKQVSRYVYNRITITLLCISVVWITATYTFVFAPTLLSPSYLPFIFALPISFLMAVIFNSIWGKMIYTFYFLSLLLWTTLLSLFFILPNNFWQVFVLGCPLQIVIILCANLVLKTKKNDPDTIHEKRKFILFKKLKKKEKELKKQEKLLEEKNSKLQENNNENSSKE